jgi:dienelactone hydrolase
MTETLLFHHALGLTAGVIDFGEQLRDAGHTVHTPDLFDGQTFPDAASGVAVAEQVGFDKIIARGIAAADPLPNDIVYAGFSLGVMPAQALAQTRTGAAGALLFHSSVPTSEFGRPWPPGVPLQMHVMEDDELGDVDIARALAQEVDTAELYLYPGSGHLVSDPGSPGYEPQSASLLRERSLELLRRVG